MGVCSRKDPEMKVHRSAVRDRIEELPDQLCVKIPYHGRIDRRSLHDKIWSAAQIDCAQDQCFIHRKDKKAIPSNTLLVTHSFFDRLSQHDAGVLYGVVTVHIQVAVRLELHIKQAMSGKSVHHMVEKTDPCGNLRFSAAIDAEIHGNIRLAGFPVDLRCSFIHGHSSSSNRTAMELACAVSPSLRANSSISL